MPEVFATTGNRGFMPQQTKELAHRDEHRDRADNSAESRPAPKGLPEDRLFIELHEMRRQIQTSVSEEFKSYSKRMLQEMKRIQLELQCVVECVKPVQQLSVQGLDTRAEQGPYPMRFPQSIAITRATEHGFSRGEVPMPSNLAQARIFQSTAMKGEVPAPSGMTASVPHKKTVASKATVGKANLLRPPTEKDVDFKVPLPKIDLDPKCPLSAHGDLPPMLPFQGEDPPAPPVVDDVSLLPGQVERPQHTDQDVQPKVRKTSLRLGAPAMQSEEEDSVDGECCQSKRLVKITGEVEEIDAPEGYVQGQWKGDARPSQLRADFMRSGSRRLSLSVDACRGKNRKKKDTRPFWKMTAAEFLNTPKFDNCIGSLILLNAIAIGVQTDYAAKNVTETFPAEFQIIERIFLGCFFAELCLRIYVHRSRFFCDRTNIAWNYFDTLIILVQVIEEVLLLIASNASLNTGMFTILRILRILRIVRILRVVRVLHLISELRTIVSSILGSLKSLAWTVVLLLLVIYIVGVYFTQAITDYMVEQRANSGWVASSEETELQYFFGSLGRTILSLWQSMSGGADWDAMAGPLISRVGFFTGLLFAGFIAFALLALMNVVTGVFVQTALQSAKDEEDCFLVDQVLKLFDKAAGHETEMLTLKQLHDKFTDPNLAPWWKSINVQPTEAKYLFSLLDVEETGEISFQEFLSGCLRLHGVSKSMDVLTVMQESRSMSRHWHRAMSRLDEYQQETRATLDGVANAVAATSTLLAHLMLNTESAVEVANQNQDKIGRLEKRIRSFESSLCSVRSAATGMNKVSELVDTLISGDPTSTSNWSASNRTASANADVSSLELGYHCTIDEV